MRKKKPETKVSNGWLRVLYTMSDDLDVSDWANRIGCDDIEAARAVALMRRRRESLEPPP
jgi:hypothetical protein